MHIHWFNPENDLALAHGRPNYTAPRQARLLHAAGALLPLWYGSPGDKVLCYGVNDRWYEQMQRDFDLQVDTFDHEPGPACVADPWGWSAYARRYFIDEGFDAARLPGVEAVERMRRLSHRSTAARVSVLLERECPGLHTAAPIREVTDPERLAELLAEGRPLVLKSPWSSSGRGVVYVTADNADKAFRSGYDAIRHQGSVMVEPWYDRVFDFARIYECRAGVCRDLGTSVFTANANGAYVSNVLAPESERLAMVTARYPAEDLARVTSALRGILEREIAPYYDGVVGVDMLITRDGKLNAVVEINLRKTMGYVANRFADMHLFAGSRGRYYIQANPSDADLEQTYTTDGGRLRSGRLVLTPPNKHFAFIAMVDEAQ